MSKWRSILSVLGPGIFAIGCTIGTRAVASTEFVLSDQAKMAVCSIRLPEHPSAAVRYAAEELRDYTEKMTGLRPAIVAKADPAVPTVELSAVEDDPLLKTDGFHLKALGNRLIVRGSATRGILYGVYELLETHGGCGFFSSTCESVPKRTAFTVRGDLDEVHRPAFDLRDPFAYDANRNPAFAAKIRKNATFGDSGAVDPKYGGVAYAFSKELFTHTFAKLVPVETYWKDHPEYFSEVNGRRIREQTQLCLTNPDVLAIAASNLLACVARESNAWCYAVSHNDCANYCTCAKCRAVIDEEGSPAGPELRFCNRLAEILEKSYPGRQVKFSAYWYTRRPPKKTKPRHNVVVDLCPFECDFARPLTKSRYRENIDFCKDLGDWAKLTSNIYLFDYIASFAQYHCPFPNVRSLQGNVRFYRQFGVRKYTAEGVYNSAHGDFAELKTWLLAKWMWNPDLDAEALLDRFFAGYYGAAAPFVRDYFEALHALPRNTEKDPLTISANTHDLGLTDAFLDRALNLWDAAEKAVADDPVRLRNVRAGKASVVTAILQFKAAGVAVTRESYPSPKLRGLATWMLAFLGETKGPFVFSEFGAQDDMLKARWRKIADPSFAVPARTKAVVEAEEVFSIAPNYGASIESDALASGGKAIRLSNVLSGEWIVSMAMGNLAFDADARYRYRLRIRADRPGPGSSGKNLFLSAVSRTNCSRDCPAIEPVADYHWYEIGEWTPKIGQTLFVAPGRYDRKKFAANPAGETLWIDQLEIERIAEGGR